MKNIFVLTISVFIYGSTQTMDSEKQKELNQQLLRAVKSAEVEKAEKLIKQGANPGIIDHYPSKIICYLKEQEYFAYKQGKKLKNNKYYLTQKLLSRHGIGIGPDTTCLYEQGIQLVVE